MIKMFKVPMHERGHWVVLTLFATGVVVFYTNTFVIKHYVKNGGERAFKIYFFLNLIDEVIYCISSSSTPGKRTYALVTKMF